VRSPSWVGMDGVRINRKGRALRVGWEDRYIAAGPVAKHDVVTVNFPHSETTAQVCIGEESCRARARGNTVVDIEPQSTMYPLYRRAAYRSSQTQWKNIERFVPERFIRWRIWLAARSLLGIVRTVGKSMRWRNLRGHLHFCVAQNKDMPQSLVLASLPRCPRPTNFLQRAPLGFGQILHAP
jgi:hypothetical protein